MSDKRRVMLKVSEDDGNFGRYEAAIIEEDGQLFAVDLDPAHRNENSAKIDLDPAFLRSLPSRNGIPMFEYMRPISIPK
jgi:hypothetical protein